MVCRSQRWRQSNDDAKAKRENLCRHSFAKRNAKGGMRCSKPAEFRQAKFALEKLRRAGRGRAYWRPSAMAKSTGGNAVELQSQLPLPVF
jgi:hypothetical protein